MRYLKQNARVDNKVSNITTEARAHLAVSSSNLAQCHFVVGGLLIGFSKSNSPKVRKMSESGKIIPLKKRNFIHSYWFSEHTQAFSMIWC